MKNSLQLKSNCKQVALLTLLGSILISDLYRQFSATKAADGDRKLSVWASWIGELPTAAEVYGDASAEIPSAEAFDDDEEDEELDASATNEYPDNENDNDNDEAYDEGEDNAESRRSESWLKPGGERSAAAAKVGGHAIWSDLEGWRRNKRDLEDRLVLASRRAAQRRRANEEGNQHEDDFAIDDGDEDAWVHDGVDDIHIDPETKRAASEMSYDERSIDAEYEPKEQIVNRTRITTIAEVIPMNVDNGGDNGAADNNDRESSRIISHFLPASQLTLDQVQHLINGKQQQRPLYYSSGATTRKPTPDDAREIGGEFS